MNSLTQTLQIKNVDDLIIPEYNEDKAIQMFKLLNNPLRLQMLHLLLMDDEVCTIDFTRLFNQVQPGVTRQLTNMKREGILTSRKISIKINKATGECEKIESPTGKWTYYRIAENKRELIKYLLTPFKK